MKRSIFDATRNDKELSEKYVDYTPEFVIDGLFKKYGKNIIAAERGSGKTRIMLFFAYAIVYDCKEILGYKINCNGDIVYVNLEIPERDFKAFVEPIRNYFEKTLGLKPVHKLHITSFKEGGNKLYDLKLIADKHKPLLMIIDSYKIYQALICIEENQRDINNANFEKVLRLLDELITEFNTTIILVNHTNKETREKATNADLMFGPGALPDFCDQITLIRKTKFANQRLIVPDKSRYCAEGNIGTNLIGIKSTDNSSPLPDQIWFELLQERISEAEFLPKHNNNRIPEEVKGAILEFVLDKNGTETEAAEKFLGDKSLKGTVSKIVSKFMKKAMK
jgi:hypothetical protein